LLVKKLVYIIVTNRFSYFLLTIYSLSIMKIILFCIKFLKQAHHFIDHSLHRVTSCSVSRGKTRFPLFQTASWSFCYPRSVFAPVSQLKLASLHEDYRACTKQGCRHTGGWVCMSTRRGMGSAPTGRERGSKGGNRSGTFVRARKFAGSIQWHRGARRARTVHRAGGSNLSDPSDLSRTFLNK